jgi:hypothetical protein
MHGKAFTQFNATFPTAVTDQWDKMVVPWDTDKSKNNPYEEPPASKSGMICEAHFVD